MNQEQKMPVWVWLVVGAALIVALVACDINLTTPKEIRTVSILCVVDDDSITVNIPETQSYTVSCADIGDSLSVDDLP